MNKKEFGKIGESVACKYLKKKNYEIIDTNFFFRGGEIDIIAFDTEKNELVFFEIKSRANKKYGLPSEAVNSTKIDHIIKGIKTYCMLKKPIYEFIRIDVLEMFYKDGKFYINHIKQVV